MKKFLAVLALALFLIPALPSAAQADWGHDHDAHYWHSGHWFRGGHLGRNGWWWVLGNEWYYYRAPVYPYPNPYTPPAVVTVPGNYWYYCRNPRGYYPYVPACAVAWRAVPPY